MFYHHIFSALFFKDKFVVAILFFFLFKETLEKMTIAADSSTKWVKSENFSTRERKNV